MRPTAAEVARTLASGRLEGTAHVRGYPARVKVRHATPADGRPLLLTGLATDLATRLTPGPMVLSVDDLPPVPCAPTRGRLWLTGTAHLLDGADAQAAADAYAEVSPIGDLLDVGRGQVLFRIVPTEVRLANGRRLAAVGVGMLQNNSAGDTLPEPARLEQLRIDYRKPAVFEAKSV